MRNPRPGVSWFVKILLLCSVSMMALFVLSMLLLAVFGKNISSVNGTIFSTILQNLLSFILPVYLLAVANKNLEFRPKKETFWMSRGPSFMSILVVVLVWVAALPSMNYLVEWNQNIHLPQALKPLEQLFRQMEDTASDITAQLLSAQSWSMMLVMLVVVGVMPALGEEIFFRSGMLGTMFYGKVNKHVAVWVVAFIFSAIHFQFFGFVPRLLLGAWLGYLLMWRGEVWTPIIAHALNNGSVVVVTFLANKKIITSNWIENIGVGKPLYALLSIAVTVVVIVLFMRKKQNTKA